MKCVYVLVVYVGSNGIGDGLTCPHWLILMMKRMGITKGNVINCLCVLCWERVEGLLNHCWCNFMFVWLWTVWCYENGHLLIICVNLSSALFWGIGCDKCYVHWERMGTSEDAPFWGTYRASRWILYFEGRIALPWLLLSRVVSCIATDAWTDMSPMGPGLRDNGCVSLGQTCIIILDITFHCIAHTYH